MYILIDRQIMAITHKHSDREVLAKLSWIECTNAGVTVGLSNTFPLCEFTVTELAAIYKNATGMQLKAYTNQMAAAVLSAARRMPDSVVNKAEVIAQAACIMDGDKSCYRYVYGSKKPEELATLYQAPAITVERCEAEELKAQQAYTPPLSPYVPPPAGGTASANHTAHVPTAPAGEKAPAAPRIGGTRETIFRVADEMWAAAGSSTDKHKILELRKQIMTELEAAHSIKKTTSSTALGDWQKARVS